MPPVVWSKNRGRNGWDSPLDVGLDRSVEAVNVTFYSGGLGTKRGGSTRVTGTGPDLVIYFIREHIPAQDQTAAELWVVDFHDDVYRSTTGTSTVFTYVKQTLKDAISSLTRVRVSTATLNGKLYWAYDSAVNRLHVFDPNNASTNTIRRAGLAPFAAAATVGNTGGGAYPATLRYYKTRNTEQQSSVTMRRSEANASVSFTPSGGGTAAQITRPTAVSENETHWEVYGSTDNVTFYGPIATIVIATTTYDDSSTPSTWAATYDAEPVAGFHTPFPSVKYLATDGKRLVGLGAHETTAGNSVTPKDGRVYFTPVLDSSSVHDDERLSNTTEIQGFIDLARNSGAEDRGLTPHPVNNIFYAFQSVGTYALIPTEGGITPYRRMVIDSAIGAVNQESIVMATDQNGHACAYFLDPIRGPYTVGGPNGLAWCGKDVKDLWDTVNYEAHIIAHGTWYPDRNLVLFWIATNEIGAGINDVPATILALDVTELTPDEHGDLRGGWSVWTGDFAIARTSCTFSNSAATTRTRRRVPHTGTTSSGNSVVLRYDESVTSDNGTSFQGYVTSGVLAQDTLDIELQRAYLAATSEAGVTIQQSLIRNFGDEANRTSQAVLTPQGEETTVLRKFEDAALQDAWAVQVTVGDPSANTSQWTLYQWRADLKAGAPR